MGEKNRSSYTHSTQGSVTTCGCAPWDDSAEIIRDSRTLLFIYQLFPANEATQTSQSSAVTMRSESLGPDDGAKGLDMRAEGWGRSCRKP